MNIGATGASLLSDVQATHLEDDTCPIKNKFHQTESGCRLIKTADNRLMHIYHKTKVSLSPKEGTPIFIYIESLRENVTFEYNNINTLYGQICTVLPRNMKYLENYLTDMARAIAFIIEMRNTSNEVSARLKKILNLENYVLSVKSNFDCYIKVIPIVESLDLNTPNLCNELLFLRPVAFQKKNHTYYREYQIALMEIFGMTAENIYAKLRKENDTDAYYNLKRTGKNQKTCNGAYFVRHPSELLDCRWGTKKTCPHVQDFKDDKDGIRTNNSAANEKNFPRCKKLWKYLFDKQILSDYVNFECQHPPNTSEILQRYFGRSYRVHTLFCFPSALLDQDWFEAVKEYIDKPRDISAEGMQIDEMFV